MKYKVNADAFAKADAKRKARGKYIACIEEGICPNCGEELKRPSAKKYVCPSCGFEHIDG